MQKEEFTAETDNKKPLELLDIIDSLIEFDSVGIKKQIDQLRSNLIAQRRIVFKDDESVIIVKKRSNVEKSC